MTKTQAAEAAHAFARAERDKIDNRWEHSQGRTNLQAWASAYSVNSAMIVGMSPGFS